MLQNTSPSPKNDAHARFLAQGSAESHFRDHHNLGVGHPEVPGATRFAVGRVLVALVLYDYGVRRRRIMANFGHEGGVSLFSTGKEIGDVVGKTLK